MKHIQRKDIHIISRHSNLNETAIRKVLEEQVYNDQASWKKFLRLFFISLGIGFTVAGIVFFFAYNWANLHKFAKIGLIEGLLITTTALALLPKLQLTTRNIILTGATVLVGVLYAVFGQVYQTGANAYDFFLAWTVFASLWVLVANFAPLWLLYLVLINTTLLLYAQQVANYWPDALEPTILFFINTAVLVTAILLVRYRKAIVPAWFLQIVALGCASYATLGIVNGIFDRYLGVLPVLGALTAIAYGAGIWFGLKTRDRFYLSIIAFSLITIVAALLLKISYQAGMLLLVGLFVVASVTLVIKYLIDLQQKWKNEQ
ncbi:MAG: DUF2157 domain-containing protein [Candidatus Pseudobacter hemicellulosilyticus]|uniref:DUF2157 domain-containing protein n=1 Tax=Candidatus Pseudobacter hemicellulosilyticus TaxID=3121375 RepID=A0AAJ5WV90_9BACT|nr:MAG: DUF2157 domain-containing protein [Pseudobacter sp.]